MLSSFTGKIKHRSRGKGHLMIASLVAAPSFSAFILASLILALTPGPGVLYILTRTLAEGRRAGLASVCGIALGNLGNAAIASFGLAVVIAASATAFTVVKWVGAAYLVYLGIRALRTKPVAPVEASRRAAAAPARVFRDGFLVALLNPKTALFFAALLPQFIQPGAAPLTQTLWLGCTFVLIALCTDSGYVFAAAALSGRFRRRTAARPYGRYLSAATFIGLGVYAAFAHPRTVK
jgi:threonine/homoserine/homoserine lactone efflux protein